MTLYLPDISGWDAGIDLAGALAVAVKATQGTGYVNPWYSAMKQEAARRGAFFIAYHFLEEGNSAQQAAHAHSVIGSGVPTLIDFEPMDPPQGQSYPSLADACGFTDHFRSAGGVTHLNYLPEWYWARNANGLGGASLKPLADRGVLLWSSNYGHYTDASDGPGWMPYGGTAPVIWQYTSSMRFGGLSNVDFSAFRGSKYAGKQDAGSVAAALAELKSLALTGKYPAAPAPPPAPLPPGDVRVPYVRGMTAIRAHNMIASRHLVPVNPGIAASSIVTGTTPASGAVKLGAKVTIHAAPAPELRSGAAGDWVKVAQTDLNKAGAHLAVDGAFGLVTQGKVDAFQAARHLGADGIIGEITWKELGDL